MRTFALSLILFSAAVIAQQPTDLQPLPAPPPPPKGMELDPEFEPQVTIIKRGDDTVEEYRIQGRLYMVKVTPPHGKAYYLVDQQGNGGFTRRDSLDSGVKVPQWVIRQF